MISKGAVITQLRAVLTRLAADSTEQKAYLRKLGVKARLDELALEFDDIFPVVDQVHENAFISPDQLEALRLVDESLREMSGAHQKRLWEVDSLDSKEWEEVRGRAREALRLLDVQDCTASLHIRPSSEGLGECHSLSKQTFLVVYDYGQGAIWGYVVAESVEQIKSEFPELEVAHERPNWMTEEREARIRRNRTVDIDERDKGFLADIIAEREY